MPSRLEPVHPVNPATCDLAHPVFRLHNEHDTHDRKRQDIKDQSTIEYLII